MEVATPSPTKWATLITILGLVVTLSGGIMTWYSSHQSTKQAAAESCIRRVDKQELLIREKAELLLASIAALGSKPQDPELTEEGFHKLGQDVLDSAMRLTAYSSPELTVATYKLSRVILIGLMARTTEEKIVALGEATTAMKGWPATYFDLMEKYNQRRTACLN